MAKIFKKTYYRLDAVYDFIKSYINKNGFPPSIREIGAGLNISSPSLIKYYIDMLESDGRLARSNTSRRVITLPQESLPNKVTPSYNNSSDNIDLQFLDDSLANVFLSPVVGQVTAGTPILANQNISDYYPLPSGEFNKEYTFMLKIVGDSMKGAGIYNGDTVIVDKLKSPTNNDIVVAMWDDCSTVKRFFRKNNGTVILHPENEAYQDIVIDNNESFNILGVVVGLVRKF